MASSSIYEFSRFEYHIALIKKQDQAKETFAP